MKKYKKVIKIVINVILWLFVAFAVVMTSLALAAQSNDGVPAIGGKCYMTVLTESMVPTFNKNDLIVGKIVTDSERTKLKEGDVISFYADLDKDGNMEINTHRIVGINTDPSGEVISYTTKGDNWAEDKLPVYCRYVISVWTGTKLSGVGGFITFLQQPKGFLLLIVLPLLLLFIYEGYLFVRTLISVKNEGKKKITEEDEEEIKRRAIEEYIREQALITKAAETAPDTGGAVEENAENTETEDKSGD